jgi:hypothetical protein
MNDKDKAMKQKKLALVAEVKSTWPAGDGSRRRQSVMLGQRRALLPGAGAGAGASAAESGGVPSSPSQPSKPKPRGSSVMEEVMQQAFSDKFGQDASSGHSGASTLSRQSRTRGGSLVPFDGSGRTSALSGTAGTADMADASSRQGISAIDRDPDPDDVGHFYADERGYYHQHQRAPVTATIIEESMDVVPVGVTLCNTKSKGTQGDDILLPSHIVDISKVIGRVRVACIHSCVCVYVCVCVCVCASFVCLYYRAAYYPQARLNSAQFLPTLRLHRHPPSHLCNFTSTELPTVVRTLHTLIHTPTCLPILTTHHSLGVDAGAV